MKPAIRGKVLKSREQLDVGLARLRDRSAPAYSREPKLDLNYLYQRHQVSLFMADNATGDAARSAHRELAQLYAVRIAEAKNRQSIAVVQ